MIIALVIVLFLLTFPLFWAGVCFLISRAGWHKLAAHFRTDATPEGQHFSMISGTVGFASYGSVLNVHIAPQGLFLSVMFLFRVGHPTVLIPWHAIQDVQPKKTLMIPMHRLVIGEPRITTLLLPEKVLREAEQDLTEWLSAK
jgi:hypothetical protein